MFTTCRDWLRTVPNLPYSQTKPEDIDTDAEDHAYDETRYFRMAHPVTPRKKQHAKLRYGFADPYRRDEDNG